MLKWLVTRGPPSSSPTPPHTQEEGGGEGLVGVVTTEDPLATLKIHNSKKKKKKKKHKNEEVYAVSRFNPLYEDDDDNDNGSVTEIEVVPEPPESPPTDRGSVRSSGYGSKETDSVSDHSEGQEDEDPRAARVLAGPGGRALATLLTRDPSFVSDIQVGVRRARSLEGLGPPPLPSIPRAATVPRPIWPRALRMLPLLPPAPSSPVDMVAQDPRYVTAISLAPAPPPPVSPAPPPSPGVAEWEVPGGYWPGPEVEPDWQGPDSLVTEETLAMMHRSHHQDDQDSDLGHSDTSSETIYEIPLPLSPGVLPVVPSPRLTQPPPRTASLASRGPSRPPPRTRRRSFDIGRPGGAVAQAALWERSGLKTNGRKLVVSLHHLAGQQSTPPPTPPPQPRLNGLDNQAFIPDPEMEVDKMAEFERRVSERLGGVPPHRTQWLDLGRGNRRVTFTPDTHSPHPHSRRPPSPSLGNRAAVHEGGTTHQQGIWTTSLSYHDRRQLGTGNGSIGVAGGGAGRAGGQELWERYYGAFDGGGGASMDRKLPRHLAPHPNSTAPICETRPCHDFTVDLRQSDKLRQLTVRSKKRRRWCCVVMVVVALSVFMAVVVAVSLYYTQGQSFFGHILQTQ